MAKKQKTVIDASDYDYKVTKFRNKDGKVRSSRGKDDAVARAMLAHAATGKDFMQVVRANKLTDKFDGKATNPGLFRMALGNSLRGLVNNGTPVIIGDVTVKTLSQRVAGPEPVKTSAKPPKAKRAPTKAAA